MPGIPHIESLAIGPRPLTDAERLKVAEISRALASCEMLGGLVPVSEFGHLEEPIEPPEVQDTAA